MSSTFNLAEAKRVKNDEFYTQIMDIENEIMRYHAYDKDVFRGKTILLPCDDPEWSNFTKFFAGWFEEFGIKKLISTSYAGKKQKIKPTLFEITDPRFDPDKTETRGKIFTLTRDINDDGLVDVDDLEWDYLEGDGDFRSDEVKALRDEADIIITNPPFSLFREFMAWIMEADKKFLIIGNMNAITYKEVFPLIKDNKVWLGIIGRSTMSFFNGEDIKKVTSCWFTNLQHGRRHEPLQLMTMEDNLKFNKKVKRSETAYKKYDNYDAMEVPFTKAIPKDYPGAMGVPISFLDNYCPEQFEILGCSYDYGRPSGWDENIKMSVSVDGQNIYKRILIKHKNI